MVSIIVTVYNVAQYLQACLESIITQSYGNIEIIIVDDGSTDSSGSICDMFAAKDSRIKVIHKKNEGLVRARKTGVQIATGDYVAYVDGDDWIEPNMIEHLFFKMREEMVDVIMCGRYEDVGDCHRKVYHGIAAGRYDRKSLLEKVYPKMIVNGSFFEWGIFPGVWDKLFRRKFLIKFQNAVDDRITMGEDAACVYPLLLNAESIYILHECLYHYRQSTNSMVKIYENIEKQREHFQILYNSVNNYFERNISIYDMREQWREYVLFLMVPRADILYQNVNKLDFLYPYVGVKKGSKIIIYGMGTNGQLLYRHLISTNYCEVVACADKNFLELSKLGLEVISPSELGEYDYDAIVIANSFFKVRNEIYAELIKRYPKEKIYMMNEKLIKSDESLKAFGLI